jgi:Fungal chitosanase of glycosyl hydrolase group 75
MQSSQTYRPNPASLSLLGGIADMIPQAKRVDQRFLPPPKFLAVLPSGQLFFDSELQLDTDGAPELAGDPTHQSDTSLHHKNRQPINANRVPYFVLPLPTSWPAQFSIRLGDLAAVIFAERIAFAIFADFGPKTKIGEGSVQLFRQLGEERVRPNGTVRDVGMGPGIITIVFPESGAPADLDNEADLLTVINSRGAGLFQELGGVLPTA